MIIPVQPITALPTSWQWKRLSDILLKLDNGSRPRGGITGIDSGILSIGAEHITDDGQLNLSTPRYIPEEFFLKMSKGILHSDDILLVKDGATTGRVAYFVETETQKIAINEHIFMLRPDKSISNPLFLFYVLLSPFGKRAILSCFHGAAQGGITKDFAKSVWIPAPITPVEQANLAASIKDQIDQTRQIS